MDVAIRSRLELTDVRKTVKEQSNRWLLFLSQWSCLSPPDRAPPGDVC